MHRLTSKSRVLPTLFCSGAAILMDRSYSNDINNKYVTNCDNSVNTYPANNPSEDRWIVKTPTKGSDWSVGAVFDGHGGWQVSDFASRNLLSIILNKVENVNEKDNLSLEKSIKLSFQEIETILINKIKKSFELGFGEVAKVGSCVLIALQKTDRLVVANCGDCRAILGSIKSDSDNINSNNCVSTRITRDHNARVAIEHYNLNKLHPNENNIVVCKNPHACYVKGRLQLTRSLGDVYLKYPEFNGSPEKHRSGGRYIPDPYTPPYVSHVPDVHHIRLTKSDKFVILATDGLWDYLPEQEAVEIVAECLKNNIDREQAAEKLVTRALTIAAAESGLTLDHLYQLPIGRSRRSRHDDTTAVVLYF